MSWVFKGNVKTEWDKKCKSTVSLALHFIQNSSSISTANRRVHIHTQRRSDSLFILSVETGVYLHSKNVHIYQSVLNPHVKTVLARIVQQNAQNQSQNNRTTKKHLDEISQKKNTQQPKKRHFSHTYAHWMLSFGFVLVVFAHSVVRCNSENICSRNSYCSSYWIRVCTILKKRFNL